MSTVHFRREGDIGVLIVDNPPVNATNMAVRLALLERVKQTDADAEVKAVVLIGADKTFVAGADIREFGKNVSGPSGRVAMEAVEASTKPFIAALHGTALGAGFELALCAQYRVALRSAKLGLPEVNIGLIPGGGGTQRLPRLMGAEPALELILNGRHFDAERALDLGVVDALIDGATFDDLLRGAMAFARKVVDQRRPLRRVRDLDDKITGVDRALFKTYREAFAQQWQGLLAPWRIVDCVEAACTQSFDAAYAFEHQCFLECRASPQRAALSHVFFAEREAAKVPRLSADVKPLPIKSVAIVGAGTTRDDIAMAFASSGISVKQLDIDSASLEGGQSVIAGCDLVIEAVLENMDIKQKVFATLDAVMKPGAILATHASSLDIDQIAAATQRPECVIGAHFLAPAHATRLLECMRGSKSSPQTIATVMHLAKTIGKIAVLAGNCVGSIGDRILAAYGRQADFLLEEGATPWQVDQVLEAFGLPMGIYLMRDMTGLDAAWRMRRAQEPARDRSLRYSPIADRICERGRYGQKTGAGYYKYNGRDASPDEEIESLVIQVSKQLGIERRPIRDAEILERILGAMVNEGAKIVGEGHAVRASDIDVACVHGYGFPRYEGGPMFWAERRGLGAIYEQVCRYQQAQTPYWEPAPLLEKAAKLGTWTAAERLGS